MASRSNPTQNRKTPGPTATRVLEAAVSTFASRGFAATSLDSVAATAGCTKQTLLHHFGSKDGLLDAVLVVVADELSDAVEAGLSRPEGDWQRLDAVIGAVFRLAARRPELLSLVREVGRLGRPFVDRLAGSLETLSERAVLFLQSGVANGVFRPHDHRLVLLSAYSSVVAAATEVETLGQLGVQPSIRILVRRRRALRDELRAILGDPHGSSPAPVPSKAATGASTGPSTGPATGPATGASTRPSGPADQQYLRRVR